MKTTLLCIALSLASVSAHAVLPSKPQVPYAGDVQSVTERQIEASRVTGGFTSKCKPAGEYAVLIQRARMVGDSEKDLDDFSLKEIGKFGSAIVRNVFYSSATADPDEVGRTVEQHCLYNTL